MNTRACLSSAPTEPCLSLSHWRSHPHPHPHACFWMGLGPCRAASHACHRTALNALPAELTAINSPAKCLRAASSVANEAWLGRKRPPSFSSLSRTGIFAPKKQHPPTTTTTTTTTPPAVTVPGNDQHGANTLNPAFSPILPHYSTVNHRETVWVFFNFAYGTWMMV